MNLPVGKRGNTMACDTITLNCIPCASGCRTLQTYPRAPRNRSQASVQTTQALDPGIHTRAGVSLAIVLATESKCLTTSQPLHHKCPNHACRTRLSDFEKGQIKAYNDLEVSAKVIALRASRPRTIVTNFFPSAEEKWHSRECPPFGQTSTPQ